ncbi:hypothetical protein DITRI_Ditri08aG0103500 [Diplodiscus trichospermus]
MQALSSGSNYGNPRNYKTENTRRTRKHYVADCESLDKVLVKHVSRLEKEKRRFNVNEEMVKVKRGGLNVPPMDEDGSLDQFWLNTNQDQRKRRWPVPSNQETRLVSLYLVEKQGRERVGRSMWKLEPRKLHPATFLQT